MAKFFRRFLALIVSIAACPAFVACTNGYDKDGGFGYVGGPEYHAADKIVDGVAGRTGLAEGVKPIDEGTEAPKDNESERPAGLITASAWNDNIYYEYFLKLFDEAVYEEIEADDSSSDVQNSESGEKTGETEKRLITPEGRFYNFYDHDRWGFDAANRVTVKVTDGETPVIGAKIKYYGKDQREFYSVTDARGVAYLFPETKDGAITVTSGVNVATSSFTAENREITVDMSAGAQKEALIKLMFVVDVTGSMGDELSYLTNELADVINRVVKDNANVKIDLAFLFYRDDGDKEKFAYYDFMRVTESQNLNVQLKNLARQRADGGGDYPEALDEALEMAVEKNWGEENSTKIIFNIYDAPPHEKDSNKACYERAVRRAAEKGIRINPVLCSGAGLLCEYLARHAAIYTGGHFVYVTDDSGIGNSHYDPDIPNAVVERLNDLMVRLIDGYYTGEFASPVSWKDVDQNG